MQCQPVEGHASYLDYCNVLSRKLYNIIIYYIGP